MQDNRARHRVRQSWNMYLCGICCAMLCLWSIQTQAQSTISKIQPYTFDPICEQSDSVSPFTAQHIRHSEAKHIGSGHSGCAYCKAEYGRHLLQASYDAPRRPYNVLSYALFMDWSRVLSATGETGMVRQFTGHNTIVIRIDSAQVSSVVLHCATMRIDSCFINGVRLPGSVAMDTLRTECSIRLGFVPRVGDTVRIDCFYTHTSSDNSAINGFFLYDKGRIGEIRRYTLNGIQRVDTFYTAERNAYTMSQPNNARNWMPCNDVPNDKAQATVTIRVPQGYMALSNGILQSSTAVVAGTIDYRWQTLLPIATYLMNVSASRYREYGEVLPALRDSVQGSRPALDVRYFVWQSDYDETSTDGTRYNARQALRSTPGMITGLERYFGAYPFEKYYTVAVQPYLYGGMEHQTMTIINRIWLRGQDLGLAHEVAHHWLGNKVTCASWSDIWMNEGGATWSEALWMESFGRPDFYLGFIRSRRDFYLSLGGLRLSALYQPPADSLFASATTYFKAGLIYHVMRRMVGDSLFFPALRSYINEFAYSSATTADMQRSFERSIPQPPIPWQRFFQQWIYSAGHPQFIMGSSQRLLQTLPVPTARVSIVVNQTQNHINVPSAFAVTMPIIFVGVRGERLTKTIIINEREHTSIHDIPFVVDSVLFDPDDHIVCEKTIAPRTVSRTETLSATDFQVFPLPVSAGDPIYYALAGTSVLMQGYAELVDMQGRYLMRIPIRERTGTISTQGLARGVYVLRLWQGSVAQNTPVVIQ